MYPHIRYDKATATAVAYPTAACREAEFLGAVGMGKDTARNRRYAEAELRRMFPANEARLVAGRTAR